MTKQKPYCPPRTRQDVTKLLGEVMVDMIRGELGVEVGSTVAYLRLVWLRLMDAAEGKPSAEPPDGPGRAVAIAEAGAAANNWRRVGCWDGFTGSFHRRRTMGWVAGASPARKSGRPRA
jgi:hypothetical protein